MRRDNDPLGGTWEFDEDGRARFVRQRPDQQRPDRPEPPAARAEPALTNFLLARRNTVPVINRVAGARAYLLDVLGALRRSTTRDVEINRLRRAGRAAARDLVTLPVLLRTGSAGELREHPRYRDFASVRLAGRFGDGDAGGLAAAVLELARGLELVRPRTPDWYRVRDMDGVNSRKRLRALAEEIHADLGALHVDASAADLRSGRWDVELLGNVIWTEQTRWPPALARLVEARSTEISPGIHRVTG